MKVVDIYGGTGGMILGLLQHYPVTKMDYHPYSQLDSKTLYANKPPTPGYPITTLVHDSSGVFDIKARRQKYASQFPGTDLVTGQLICSDLAQAEYKPGTTCTESFRQMQHMLDLISTLSPNYVVIETTEGFKSADGGALYSYWCRSLAGQGLTHSVHNVKSYGCSFRRERVYLVARRALLPVGLLPPMAGHRPYKPLRAALGKDGGCQPSIGKKFTPATAEKFSKVQPGEYLRRGEFFRLAWDMSAPDPTLKSGKHAHCHPDELRPLTVNETKRLLGYPDEFVVTGTMREQYQQLIQSPAPAHCAELFRRLRLTP